MMRKQFYFFLIGLVMGSLACLSVCSASPANFARKTRPGELLEIKGDILRFYEDRSGEWASYILLKDTFGDETTIHVHPQLTLVKRKDQILQLHQITGGMKAAVIYQKSSAGIRAVSINVSGIFYG